MTLLYSPARACSLVRGGPTFDRTCSERYEPPVRFGDVELNDVDEVQVVRTTSTTSNSHASSPESVHQHDPHLSPRTK